MVSDTIPMTRARLYVLIDAFERDMRDLLARFVSPVVDENTLLGPLYDKAEKRRNDDEGGSLDSPLVEYLDLREAYDLLNRHRKSLPDELAREIRESTPSMDRLVSIRRRVMHPRPLLADDNEAAPIILNQFATRYWRETQRVLAQLQSDPVWEPLVSLKGSDSATLHNLPLPDYDETGLIGRDSELESIARLVKRGRESVITVTGEGGIGKTALALEVAYALADDPGQPFDAILWTSLKHERLTARGIKEIANAARDLTSAIGPLGRAFDASFNGGLQDLSEALTGLRTLVVFDNLETIGGIDFNQLYEALPDTASYLVTSRIGVGEYERRFPLSPLAEKDSLRLFNNFIQTRRLDSLRRLTGETRSKIVARLRHSPLAIRWFILAVEAGRDPLVLIRDQTELLEFCVRSVYDELSDAAQSVLSALAVLGRPITVDELVVLLDESADVVNIGLQELVRGSLVRRDSTGSIDDLALRVRLTETANQFLSQRVAVDPRFAGRIASREREYRKIEERRIADTKSRSLAPVVVRTNGPQDVPTAQILRRALLTSRSGNVEEALTDVETAQRLNPDFWEVDRVEGFILASAGHAEPALVCYENAYRKAEGEGRGVVAHFLAGHLARNLRNVEGAIIYAREAHEEIGTSETAVALGNYLVWSREFQEGIGYIEPAVASSTGKGRLIAVSSLAEGYRRWAEFARDHEKNPILQFRRASKGLDIALASIEAGVTDRKIRDVAAECAVAVLSAAAAASSDGMSLADLSSTIERLGRSLVRLTGTPSWARMEAAAQRLGRGSRSRASVARLVAQMTDLRADVRIDNPVNGDRYVGEVISLQAGYGFIRHPGFPSNLFFHSTGLVDGGLFEDLVTGALVSFSVKEGDRGLRAIDVNLA